MSVEENGAIELVNANDGENTAPEPEKIIPTTSAIDINEMQPNIEKVVHVTKIYIPPNEPNVAEVNVMASEAASETVNCGSLHVVLQSEPLAGSVVDVPAENGEIVPIQLQPTYPAAHPLPDITVDIDHPTIKVGEIVPITIQPTYPMAHNVANTSTSDDAVIPAYPAGHLSIPPPILEESVPTVQIKPDLVRFGTVVTDDSVSISEVPYSPEPLYPAAHHLPVVSAAVLDEDGMNEIPLSGIEPGTSGQISGNTHPTANGTSNTIHVTVEQSGNTSKKRGIVLTVVLAVLLVSSFAVWGVYRFILQTSPA